MAGPAVAAEFSKQRNDVLPEIGCLLHSFGRKARVNAVHDRIGRLFVVGLATDFCVAWTALDARRQGFATVVIEDACRAIDHDSSLARALADMDAAGVGRIKSAAL